MSQPGKLSTCINDTIHDYCCPVTWPGGPLAIAINPIGVMACFGDYKWTIDRILCIWPHLIKPNPINLPSNATIIPCSMHVRFRKGLSLTCLLEIIANQPKEQALTTGMQECSIERSVCKMVLLTGCNTRLQAWITADIRGRQSDLEAVVYVLELVIIDLIHLFVFGCLLYACRTPGSKAPWAKAKSGSL
jgi:hypothetical protein